MYVSLNVEYFARVNLSMAISRSPGFDRFGDPYTCQGKMLFRRYFIWSMELELFKLLCLHLAQRNVTLLLCG